MAECQYIIFDTRRAKGQIMDYIQNMIDIRRENRDRQEDLAKKTGWSRIQIARYETRKSTPTIDYLEAFCTVYKVSANRILGLPKDYK